MEEKVLPTSLDNSITKEINTIPDIHTDDVNKTISIESIKTPPVTKINVPIPKISSTVSVNSTYPIFYGSLSYGYLDGTIPNLFEEKDVALPESIYKNVDLKRIQPFRFQLSHSAVPEDPSPNAYVPRTYNIPITRHFSFYSFPKFENPKHPFDDYMVVAFIKTTWKRIQNRNVIRQSYMNLDKAPMLKNKMKFYFIVGFNPSYINPPELIKEQETYNDMIIVNVIDQYNNLTIKTLMLEDMFVALNSTAKYYMSIDDDVCIDPYRIYKHLLTAPRTNYYIGKKIYEHPSKELTKSHSIPEDVLPIEYTFAYGPAYIMSSDILYCHIQQIRKVNGFFHVDDAFVGYLTTLCNVQLQPINRWMGDAQKMLGHSLEFSKREYFTAHHLGRPEQLNEVCISVYSRTFD
ncbi:hypothetical protein WA158_005371 [Blastocystis sp. Blastoise]